LSNIELESAEMAPLREEFPSGKKADKNKKPIYQQVCQVKGAVRD
jgi:hypothetical protein